MLLGIVGGIIARRRISGAEIQITGRWIDGIGIHVAEPMDGRIVIAVLMASVFAFAVTIVSAVVEIAVVAMPLSSSLWSLCFAIMKCLRVAQPKCCNPGY
jgi:hypothetical protein